MINGIRLGDVMIDSADSERLCSFYESLLGWRRAVLFGLPSLISENDTVFMFMEESDYVPPVWPEEDGLQQKQIHFDFQVPNVPDAVAYCESLGAKKSPVQFCEADRECVMFDPAGHPFCLCASSNIG
ncbi:hypothetical protein SDC9_159682 [bioreactor metagenome]|uniref:VOC domain-containing protein n=1 Tax=bioreactor metagenome TaxID=1076179 RepID=A0A645FIV0_9ZZZZ